MHSKTTYIFIGVTLTVIYTFVYNVLSLSHLSGVTNVKLGRHLNQYGAFYQGQKVKNWTCRHLLFSERRLPLTALASVPGSGTKWVRHLVQQATGVLTGSIHRNERLSKQYGFQGEGVTNGSVILVWTNEPITSQSMQFDRVLLLIRDPYDAIMADFHGSYGGPTEYANETSFQKEWYDFALTKIRVWEHLATYWLSSKIPLLIVQYDHLKNNIKNDLERILHFLSLQITTKDMWCALKNAEGLFKRHGRPQESFQKHYTPELTKTFEDAKTNVYAMMERLINKPDGAR